MPQVIDELLTSAGESLKQGDYHEAERACMKALVAARRARDYERLARVCAPLQEARYERLAAAHAAGDPIRIISQDMGEHFEIQPGCYIIDPMLVAADARRLRLAAFERNIPVAVLCREPITRLGLQPVVALGEVVVRTRIRPATDFDHPTLDWFIGALDALGEAALNEIDPALEGERRIDALLDRLDAVSHDELLHEELAKTARETARLVITE